MIFFGQALLFAVSLTPYTMRTTLFSLLALTLLTLSCQTKPDTESQQAADTVAAAAPKEYTIEQLMDNERVFGGSLSHDKTKVFVTSNRSGINNLYTIPIGGGEYTPITQSDSSSLYGISYFPNDSRILFQMDDNGNEIYHLYLLDQQGAVKELTPGKEARASFYGWAQDENSFYYGSNKRDSRYMDVYEMDLATLTPRLLYQNDQGFDFGAISPNEQYLALSKSINTNDADLYLYDLKAKQLTKINEQQAAHTPTNFSTDSRSLNYLTDAGNEFAYLMKYDLASKQKEKVYEDKWDVVSSNLSHKGTYRVLLVNEDGRNKVVVQNAATGEPIALPRFEGGDVTNVGISRDESIMTFYVGSSSTPSNLYVMDLGTNQHTRLTNVLNPEINPEDLVSAEVIRFNSYDGTEIPAIYYKPKQASATNKVPALVWVHGGPGGQSRQNYFPLIQYLVNHGYAVLAVNNRGSSGYGKTFYKMDDRKHGDADLKDIVESKSWLEEQPNIDGSKIGIIGGSYGGYMVMAALAFEPETFDVGVNIFGVTNWLRTLKSIPPWWESFKDALYQEMGDPNTADSVRLYNISPVFHAQNVTKPLMVLQGAKDPRVLQVESDEIVAAVKENQVPVEYVLFEDEGHGFVKKDNEIEGYGKVLQFLDKYLKGNKS